MKTDYAKYHNKQDRDFYESNKEPKKVYHSYIVNVNALAIRAEPDKTSEKIDVVPRGTLLTVCEVMDEWCKIKYKTKECFVMKRHIEKR
jgi:SH3-like domain-containing protein